MADNVQLNAPTTQGDRIATDEIDWVQHQLVKLEFGENGTAIMVSKANPLPVSASIDTVGLAIAANQQTNSLTNAELRALPIAIKEQPDATATYSPNSSTSVAYEASRVAKSSAGTLYSVTGYNSKESSQFIQLHNSTTLPLDTAIPVVLLTVPPYSNFSYSADKFGRFFSNGITICNSLTGATKTIGLADVWFDIQYL